MFQREEVRMPTYDFMCEKCAKPFVLMLSLAEYEKGKFRCPACKSTKVRQQVTSFTVNTSKKS
jgi:putative FmdB family regulatory protein